MRGDGTVLQRQDLRRPRQGLKGSRGEFTGGCLFILALMAIAGFVGYKFTIPYYEYSTFESRLSEMMPYYRNHDGDYVQGAVIGVAKEFNLNLKPEQVKVQVLRKVNRLIIDVEYQRTVEFPFYVHTLTFRPHLTGTVY